jgi:hypothetical protein
LINEFTGQPFPGNQIPASLQSPIAQLATKLYPLPNIGANVFESTQLGSTNYDQGGFRLDHYFGAGDQLFARFSTSSLNEFDPLHTRRISGWCSTTSVNRGSHSPRRCLRVPSHSHVGQIEEVVVLVLNAARARNGWWVIREVAVIHRTRGRAQIVTAK